MWTACVRRGSAPSTQRDLEAVALDVAREWGITIGMPFPQAQYSYVAPADGAVLKVAPPDDDESIHEADALELWDGDGAVRLLRRDDLRRALLLQRADPGHDASRLLDDEAIAVALAVGARLWRPIPRGPYLRASARVPAWLAAVEPTGHPLVTVARRILGRTTMRDDTLVHGDLHHHNLLRDADRWLAIDPKPLLAEPEWDVVTLLWNPIATTPTLERTERRIALMTAAGLDEQRIRDWAVIRGTYLGLPLGSGENETTSPQLLVVRQVLGA